MAKDKEEKKEKYVYELIVKCTECGTVAVGIGPCIKCKNLTFARTYKAVVLS